VERTAELVDQIAAATGEEARGADRVSRSIQELREGVQESAASAEELAATAEELARGADELRRAVAFFQTDGVAPRRRPLHALHEPHSARPAA
ncbi:MAG: methyl-accepting chemotaxis protein, partial [Anaeromyxobacteraceae bacterium]